MEESKDVKTRTIRSLREARAGLNCVLCRRLMRQEQTVERGLRESKGEEKGKGRARNMTKWKLSILGPL